MVPRGSKAQCDSVAEPSGRGPAADKHIGVYMDDQEINRRPEVLDALRQDTEKLGFTMASEPKTGALLAVLAASKPGGRFLELGTGTGLGTAWLLFGMDADSRLDTVDTDANVMEVAKRHLGADSRVTFH